MHLGIKLISFRIISFWFHQLCHFLCKCVLLPIRIFFRAKDLAENRLIESYVFSLPVPSSALVTTEESFQVLTLQQLFSGTHLGKIHENNFQLRSPDTPSSLC